MNVIGYKEIEKEFESLFPDADLFWFTDQMFEVPTRKELGEVVQSCSVKGFKFRDSVMECDDYSLQLVASIRRKRALEEGAKYNLAFGEVFGIQSGLLGAGPHYWNICYAKEGVYFIEPQTDELMLARSLKKSLNPLRIKM